MKEGYMFSSLNMTFCSHVVSNEGVARVIPRDWDNFKMFRL